MSIRAIISKFSVILRIGPDTTICFITHKIRQYFLPTILAGGKGLATSNILARIVSEFEVKVILQKITIYLASTRVLF